MQISNAVMCAKQCTSHTWSCVTDSCPHVLGCSEGDAEETIPASRVFSSQIPGYAGREVDTDDMVEVVFPIIVRRCFSDKYIRELFLHNI